MSASALLNVINNIFNIKNEYERQAILADSIITLLKVKMPLTALYKPSSTRVNDADEQKIISQFSAKLVQIQWTGTDVLSKIDDPDVPSTRALTKKLKKNGYFQFVFSYKDDNYTQQSLVQTWRHELDKMLMSGNNNNKKKQASSAWKDIHVKITDNVTINLMDILPLEIRRLENSFAIKAWFVANYIPYSNANFNTQPQPQQQQKNNNIVQTPMPMTIQTQEPVVATTIQSKTAANVKEPAIITDSLKMKEIDTIDEFPGLQTSETHDNLDFNLDLGLGLSSVSSSSSSSSSAAALATSTEMDMSANVLELPTFDLIDNLGL